MNDPIVDEVRETRNRIFDECGGDLEGLIRRLRAAESKHSHRLVTTETLAQRKQMATESNE